jgi:hypothetical protein
VALLPLQDGAQPREGDVAFQPAVLRSVPEGHGIADHRAPGLLAESAAEETVVNATEFRMRAGDPRREPGYWAYFQRNGRGPMTALVSCPLCGKTSSLEKHDIDFRGLVQPVVLCGNDYCKWTTVLLLIDWDPFRRS